MGDPTEAGHQSGSLAMMASAAWEPSGTLFPEPSSTTTLVPEGTVEIDPMDPPELLGAVRPVPPSARAGTVKRLLSTSMISVLMDNRDISLFLDMAHSPLSIEGFSLRENHDEF